MREAVIVSTARTPIGKAYRGAFNDTQAQTLGGHAIANALQRASVDPGEIDDVVMGAAMQQGSQGGNVARQALLRAGLPTSVAGMSLDRQCASGPWRSDTRSRVSGRTNTRCSRNKGPRRHKPLAGSKPRSRPWPP
jgi:hypothetical protein